MAERISTHSARSRIVASLAYSPMSRATLSIDPLGEIVNAMLATDPRDRPSADEVMVALSLDSPTAQHVLSV